MDHSFNISQPLLPPQCPAYILAGGRSSRFGSDKARVQVDHSPLLVALRQQLIQQGHAVEVVADRADRYADLGIECLVDWQADQGPLAGVATALKHRAQQQPGWLLLLSCDLLVWRAAWFEQLSAAVQQLPSTAAGPATQETATQETAIEGVGESPRTLDAIAFQRRTATGKSQAEPFPSLLHSRLGPQAVALLDRHSRSLRSLFADAQTRTLENPDNPQAWTFNTLEQLHALLR